MAVLPALGIGLYLIAAPMVCAQDAGPDLRKPHQANSIPDALYIPTPHDVVAKMLELAGVRKEDVVYDLGCGDGRIVVAAAKTYGCRAVGFDIDPLRVKDARENVKKNRLDALVRIEHKDVFEVDLRPATVVTLYLTPRYNARLLPQLERLRPGSRIVSHESGMRGIKPESVIQVVSPESGRKHTLYLWTAPFIKLGAFVPTSCSMYNGS
jgi:SAM-dependent methyltransferase